MGVMNINFLATKETLEALAKMEVPPEDYDGVSVSVDLIELPFWFLLESGKEDWILTSFRRFNNWDYPPFQGPDFIVNGKGHWPSGDVYKFNKKTGQGEGTVAGDQLLPDLETYFRALRNLFYYVIGHELDCEFDSDDDVLGNILGTSVLLSVENGTLTYKRLSLQERPDIMCTMSGSLVDILMRPEGWTYFEERWG